MSTPAARKPDWARDLPDRTPDGDPIVYGPRPMSPRVAAVEALDGRRLRVDFENGEERIFDASPHVGVGVFAPLADPAAFAAVRVVNGGGGVAWDTGADLSRDTLYLEGQTAEHDRCVEREA